MDKYDHSAITKKAKAKIRKIPSSAWTLMDNWLLKEAYEGNAEAATLLLRTVTKKSDLFIKEVQVQAKVNLGMGVSKMRFDLLALGEDNHHYVIEMQQSQQSNIIMRASYYCDAAAMLNTKGIAPKYYCHHDTTVIFFCQQNVPESKRGILHFCEKDVEGRKVSTYRDCYIISVNEVDPQTPLGKLAKDLTRSDGKYIYKELQNAYNKVDKTRRTHMTTPLSKIFDEMAEEVKQLGIEQGREEGIEQGIKQGIEKGRKEGIQEGREEGVRQGKEEGLSQGRKEGEEKGRNETKAEIAANMKGRGLSDEFISSCTGMTLHQVRLLSPKENPDK